MLEPEPEDLSVEQSDQGSAQNKAPEVHNPVIPAGRPKQLPSSTPPSVAGHEKGAPVVVGSAVLKD